MTAQTSRLMLMVVAFVAALAFSLSLVLLLMPRGVPVSQGAPVGGPFRLIDQDGRIVTEQDVKGRPFLVFFGYTYCPDVCPTTLFDISEIFRKLGPDADRAAALFITVDPERDTQQKLKAYLSSFNPHLRGLTGEPAAIDAAVKAYRAYSKKVPDPEGDGYTMDHTALVYLMDKEGRFVAPFNLKRRPEDSAADLRRYF